jgi:hypothetical protein
MSETSARLQSTQSPSHLAQALQLSIESLEREYAIRRRASACGERAMAASVSKAYRLAIAHESEQLARLRQEPPPPVPY